MTNIVRIMSVSLLFMIDAQAGWFDKPTPSKPETLTSLSQLKDAYDKKNWTGIKKLLDDKGIYLNSLLNPDHAEDTFMILKAETNMRMDPIFRTGIIDILAKTFVETIKEDLDEDTIKKQLKKAYIQVKKKRKEQKKEMGDD